LKAILKASKSKTYNLHLSIWNTKSGVRPTCLSGFLLHHKWPLLIFPNIIIQGNLRLNTQLLSCLFYGKYWMWDVPNIVFYVGNALDINKSMPADTNLTILILLVLTIDCDAPFWHYFDWLRHTLLASQPLVKTFCPSNVHISI